MTDLNQISTEQTFPVQQPGAQRVAKVSRGSASISKTDLVLKQLRTAKGASVEQLAEATGWQLHSVRGFLSATIRKKLGLNLVSTIGKDEVRRYRVVAESSSREA